MSQSVASNWWWRIVPARLSLGAEYVARAPKDGYTLLMCTVAQTINPAMNNLSFDFARTSLRSRFSPMHPDAGGASLATGEQYAELIALAKSQPDACICLVGVGTMSHLRAAAQQRGGIKLQQIPYPAARRA